MPDPDATPEGNRTGADERSEPVVADAVATTEAYDIDEGVVFYDAENPLAWIQSDAVLELEEMA